MCLGLGCFAAFLVAAVSNQRKIIHSYVEKTLFCLFFLQKSIHLLQSSAPFPDVLRMLGSNNMAHLADIKQLLCEIV